MRKVLSQLAAGGRPGESLLWATGDRVSLHAAVVGKGSRKDNFGIRAPIQQFSLRRSSVKYVNVFALLAP